MSVLIKSFPETADSKVWGVSVFSFGEMMVTAQTTYPLKEFAKEHPHFWERGRVLDQLFLVYISEGKGEARFGDKPTESIAAGSMLILYPGINHRYRPHPISGWTETWVGLKGAYITFLLKKPMVFGPDQIIHFEDPTVVEAPLKLIKNILCEEKMGYQVRAAELVISLLSKLYLQKKQEYGRTSRIEKIIAEARANIENMSTSAPLDIKALATELDVSYSWFRKMYKLYTGCSPVQYRILLNIERASQLLVSSHLSVKEIAYTTGFESEAYFCRQFKQKQGMSPTEFRTKRVYQ